MTTFALIHGAGGCGWVWHLLEEELRCIGHETLAPDLPCEDDSCGFAEYAEAVVEAVDGSGTSGDVVVVGHSLGGCTAPLPAGLLGATQL
ncbi:MAG: alpha/beta hydrolase, partial [Micrococcales bacterium]